MTSRKVWSPERRDVIWIDCKPQAGREMKDIHPLLVLSPKAFNEGTGIVIGLPMTTAAYNDSNPFAIRFVGARGIVRYILAPAKIIRLADSRREDTPHQADFGGCVCAGV